MTEKEFIGTGIPKLDELLGGGIQKGSTMLLSGVPGSNIELITKQFASVGNLLYVTTDETQEDIIETMKQFSWDVSNIIFEDIAKRHLMYLYEGETKRVSIYKQRSKQKIKELIQMGSKGLPPLKQGEEDYLAIISENLRSNPSKKIIINTLDFFLNTYRSEDVIRVIKSGKVNITENKGVLIIVMTRGMHSEVIERQLESLADSIIDLYVVQKGPNFERILSVKKIRNFAKKIGTARYDINDNGFIFENIERIM
ncbi:MAG: ATPase domain-containing protein [Thermoplasmatota archaeon]